MPLRGRPHWVAILFTHGTAKTVRGQRPPPGEYRYLVEANLRWNSRVVYRGTIQIGGAARHSMATGEFSGGNAQEREMITGVAATYYP